MSNQLSDPWLITAAVDREIHAFRGQLESLCPEKILNGKAWSGRWQGKPVLLVRTGIGPKKAEAVIAPLIANRKFVGIISIGYSGALQIDYRIGDIVVPEEIQAIEPLPQDSFHPDKDLLQKAWSLDRDSLQPLHKDRMLTTDRVISSSHEKKHLGKKYKAGSVEMESAVIARLAEKASIPFLVIRVILDEANFSFPDTLQVLYGWRQRQWRQLFSSIFNLLFKLPQLLKLARHTRTSAKNLSCFLLDFLHSTS